MTDLVGIGLVLVFLGVVMALLPESPFGMLLSYIESSTIFDYVGIVIPFDQIITLTETWLVAVSIIYGIVILARWVKLIGS